MRSRAILLLFGLILHATIVSVSAEDITVSGTVRSKGGKKKLASVSIMVPGTNIGTVSNRDGSYSIKVPDSLSSRGLKAEQIGFISGSVTGRELSEGRTDNLTIWLEPLSGKMLDEVTVYGADPRKLVESAIRKIPENYPSGRNLFSSFYRETVRKGNRYIGVSEAVMDVLKNPYARRSINGDRVRIEKGRRLVSQRTSDTLSVKLLGGPNLPVVLDMVKNENLIFSPEELNYYEFHMEPMTSIDDRRQFVVSFKPCVKVNYPLFNGKLYIDLETSSFTKAELSLDMSDKDKVTRSMLYKRPSGLRFNPQEVEYIVTYKYQDGVSYLNYISAKTRFKCDWKKRLFSSGYTIFTEMVMIDRDDSPIASISRKEAFGDKDIFYDKVDNFIDPDFWKDYNIIEPTESLEKAVLKIQH